jgi:hypothetical protein
LLLKFIEGALLLYICTVYVLFQLTLKDIEKFENKYRESEEEKEDVIKAYLGKLFQ